MVRIVFAGVVCCAVTVAAQERPTFRLSARTVYIYATVQSDNGRLVPDLTRDDFVVLDDDRPQPITVFDNTPQPITMAAMFDMSRSMAGQYPRIRDAATAFVNALWPDDRARIGSFGMEVAISPFLTSDKAILRRIVDEELWPGKNTPLWYATEVAMTALEEEPGRRVVLLFTDGVDSYLLVPGSRKKTREMAVQGGFMVYAVGLKQAGLSDEMTHLASLTGGGHYLVDRNEDLGEAFARVVEELHHQYVIGFVTDAADGRAHKLTVRTKKPDMRVRARKNYIASRETGDVS